MTQKLSWRDSHQVNQSDREKVWIIIMYFFLYVAFKENFDLQIKKKKDIIARSSTEAEYRKWYIIQQIAWSQREMVFLTVDADMRLLFDNWTTPHTRIDVEFYERIKLLRYTIISKHTKWTPHVKTQRKVHGKLGISISIPRLWAGSP